MTIGIEKQVRSFLFDIILKYQKESSLLNEIFEQESHPSFISKKEYKLNKLLGYYNVKHEHFKNLAEDRRFMDAVKDLKVQIDKSFDYLNGVFNPNLKVIPTQGAARAITTIVKGLHRPFIT